MTTRSHRRFTDQPVSESDIVTCLRAANQAPSGGNIQPWQFLVVTDPEARARIGAIYRRAYHRYEAALLPRLRFRSPEHEAGYMRQVAASRHLAEHLPEVPVLVLVLMPEMTMTISDSEGELDVGTPYASVYPAVQNFILAARGVGLGTVLTTVFRIYQEEVRAVCDIPGRFQIVALLPLGHPAGGYGVAPRRPVEELTHWNRFGSRR